LGSARKNLFLQGSLCVYMVRAGRFGVIVLERDLLPPDRGVLLDLKDKRVRDYPPCKKVGLLGVPWDWSTAGDPGARHAPAAIRWELARLPSYSPSIGGLTARPWDFGDVRVDPRDWEGSMGRIRRAAGVLFGRVEHALFLGGDHSITREIVGALLDDVDCVGILMFDAHFDLREPEGGVTSGSWLAELYREYGGDRVKTVILGVGEYTNPSYLAEKAERLGIDYLGSLEVYHDLEAAYRLVEKLAGYRCDAYYVTVDMDHISEAYAPGVNSPSPIGLEPHHTLSLLAHAIPLLRPRGLDIVEVVPVKDRGGATVRLAARIALFASEMGCRVWRLTSSSTI